MIRDADGCAQSPQPPPPTTTQRPARVQYSISSAMQTAAQCDDNITVMHLADSGIGDAPNVRFHTRLTLSLPIIIIIIIDIFKVA